MGDFRVVKSLVGDTVEMGSGPAHGALEEGDLAKWNTNRIQKVVNDDTANDLVLVKEDAAEQDDIVQYVWLDPWVLIEGTVKGTVAAVGDHVHIDVTSDDITFELDGTTQVSAKFEVREVVDATAKLVRAVRLSGELNAT